jgi:DnaJ-class molecular chaperone
MCSVVDKDGSLYSILGLEHSASIDDIRHAYRGHLVECHPDKNKSPEAALRFRAITDAYEVLSDELKKQEYDIMLCSRETASLQAEEVDISEFLDEPSSELLERPCRCGYSFAISKTQYDQGFRVIQCSGCSIHVKIS